MTAKDMGLDATGVDSKTDDDSVDVDHAGRKEVDDEGEDAIE